MKNENSDKPNYDVKDLKVSDLIDQLVSEIKTHPDSELIREIIVTGIKLAEDRSSRGEIKIMRSAVKEMRHAFRVFSQYRHTRKVSVFGSARTQPGDAEYQLAKDLGRELARSGFMVITGAGEGIMGAAHHGAGREQSIGLNILLPFEQDPNSTIAGDPKLINFRYFFTRKLFFVKESDAIILMPGGFGTQDEGFETLTLLQTGRDVPKPLIMLDSKGEGGYWDNWRSFVRETLLGKGTISDEDLSLFKLATDVDQVCNEIRNFYSRYHSSRYVSRRSILMIRLNDPLEKNEVDQLNSEFEDILSTGRIEMTTAHPEEMNETDLLELPRLAVPFDQFHFGRLRELIDRINRFQRKGH